MAKEEVREIPGQRRTDFLVRCRPEDRMAHEQCRCLQELDSQREPQAYSPKELN